MGDYVADRGDTWANQKYRRRLAHLMSLVPAIIGGFPVLSFRRAVTRFAKLDGRDAVRKVKGVMLLPPDAQSYRRHVAHHTFVARVNAAETTPDYRAALTLAIESRVREELKMVLTPTRHRVLRWEETGPTNRSTVRYRELDGVYKTPSGATVLLEVKASASKGSLSSGIRQLRAAVATLALAQPLTCGLLVIVDLGAIVEGFGEAAAVPVTDYFVGTTIETCDWPPETLEPIAGGLIASVIPQEVATVWLSEASALDNM